VTHRSAGPLVQVRKRPLLGWVTVGKGSIAPFRDHDKLTLEPLSAAIGVAVS
jgi:hypothetical protein